MAQGSYGQSKSQGVRSVPGPDSGEDASNQGMGPTGSSRSYPKGGSAPGNTQSAPFNPQKVPATDWAVGGV